jgi:hypothetical protein
MAVRTQRMTDMFLKPKPDPRSIDLDALLRATAGAANVTRRIRDGINAVLAEAGNDTPRVRSIHSSLSYMMANAENLLRSIAEAEAVLDGGVR